MGREAELEASGSRHVIEYADEQSAGIHALLRGAQTAPEAAALVRTLSQHLLDRIRHGFPGEVIPVCVMRGGLLMWRACMSRFPHKQGGIIVPNRDAHDLGSPVRIGYFDVPVTEPGATTYLLMDPIVDSGRTIVAALRALREGAGEATNIVVASLYATPNGCSAIHSEGSDVTIHTMWADTATLNDVAFDMGELVLA